jgi:hypothetical protein
MPALLTSTSISPASRRARSIAARVESQSATLPSAEYTSCPPARISLSQRSRRGEPGPQPAITT